MVMTTPLPHRVDFAKKMKSQKKVKNIVKNRVVKTVNWKEANPKKSKKSQKHSC